MAIGRVLPGALELQPEHVGDRRYGKSRRLGIVAKSLVAAKSLRMGELFVPLVKGTAVDILGKPHVRRDDQRRARNRDANRKKDRRQFLAERLLEMMSQSVHRIANRSKAGLYVIEKISRAGLNCQPRHAVPRASKARFKRGRHETVPSRAAPRAAYLRRFGRSPTSD